MRLLRALFRLYTEGRKGDRVIAELDMEARRLRLSKDNRELARYLDGLKKYLEDV